MRVEASGSRWTLTLRLAIGLAQGLALAALWRVREARPPWAVDGALHAALWMIALYVPLIPLAALSTMRPLVLAAWTLAAAALLAGLTVHDVWRALPDFPRWVVVGASESLWIFAAAALFVLHHLVEAADVERRWWPPYRAYVADAWRHAFQLPLALAFTGVLWGLLQLGTEMFAAIKLQAVAEALNSAWLAWPLVCLAFAFAVERTDVQPSLIEGVRRIGLALLAWLLPAASLLVTVFLLALLVTGLAPLWATHKTTGLLLAASAALVVFVNAAYQDGSVSATIPRIIRWSGRLAALLLAVLVALAAWGLALRIGQYGLSPQRVQATVICALAVVYAGGYAWAACARDAWMRPIERVNVVAAVAVVVVIVLVFSPVVDPARLAAASQAARLESGKVAPARFDFDALRFDMVRYGRAQLARLADSKDAEVARLAKISQQKSYAGQPEPDTGAAFANAVVQPAGATLPPGFREQDWANAEPKYATASCLYSAASCVLRVIDLDDDGRPEVVALTATDELLVYMRDPDGLWRPAGRYYWRSDAIGQAAFAAGRVEAVPPRLDDLRIGERRAWFSADFNSRIGKELTDRYVPRDHAPAEPKPTPR